MTYSYVLDILLGLEGSLFYGNSVSSYCFPLRTVYIGFFYDDDDDYNITVVVYICTVVKSIFKVKT